MAEQPLYIINANPVDCRVCFLVDLRRGRHLPLDADVTKPLPVGPAKPLSRNFVAFGGLFEAGVRLVSQAHSRTRGDTAAH